MNERLGTNFALFLLSFQPVTLVNMAVEKATVLVTGEAHVMICYQIDRFSHLCFVVMLLVRMCTRILYEALLDYAYRYLIKANEN